MKPIDNFSRLKILLPALISVALLLNILAYSHGNYLFFGDVEFPITNPSALLQLFFVWQPSVHSGIMANAGSPINILSEAFYLLIYDLFGTRLGVIAILWINETIGAIGMFFLVLKLTKEISKKVSYIGAFVSSVAFMMTFETQQNSVILSVVFLPCVLLALYSIVEDKSHEKKMLMVPLLALSLALEFICAANVLFIPVVVLFALLSLMLVMFKAKESRFFNLKLISASFLLAILITLPYILTTYSLISHQHLTFGNQVLRNSGFLNHTSIFYYFSAFTSFEPTHNATLGVPTGTEFIFISLFFVFVIGVAIAGLNKKNMPSFFILSIIIIYFLFLPLSRASAPLSGISGFLHSHIPYLLQFSLWNDYPVFIVLFSVLLGYGCANIINSLMKKRIYLALFCVLLVSLLFFYIYVFDYLPILQANYQGSSPNHVFPNEPQNFAYIQNETHHGPFPSVIPNYVYQTSNYINSQYGCSSAGVLPVTSTLSSWQISSWYWSSDIYGSLLNCSLYGNGFGSDTFSSTISENYYESVGTEIDTEPVNFSISNVFGVLGINYIIVQLDTLHEEQAFLAPTWNSSILFDNLNSSSGIDYITSFGNETIFQNRNVDPLVYASNIKNIGNATDALVVSTLENKSFNIQNTSIYSTNGNASYYIQYGGGDISLLYNAIGHVNATGPYNFIQPGISFIQNSPTKITVYVNNAVTPYYMVLRQSYDPFWTAIYSNGTDVGQYYHIQVNGFANAWYINKTGSYTVTLYYAPQSAAWIYWYVSFAAFGAACLMIYSYNVKAKKVRNKE